MPKGIPRTLFQRIFAKKEKAKPPCRQKGVGRGSRSPQTRITYKFVQFLKNPTIPQFLGVIPSEAIKRSRGISTEPRRRGRGMNTPSFSFAKSYFACVELQRFCLDPTAAPSALWFARLLRCTSQTSIPLRFTQDDADGCAAPRPRQQCGCCVYKSWMADCRGRQSLQGWRFPANNAAVRDFT